VTPGHVHPGPAAGPGPAELVIAGAALLVTVVHLAAAGRLRRRGGIWPRARDTSFAAGGAGTAWATLAEPWGGPFTQHVVRHLVVGMAAPLLFVAVRPLTLALRALTPGRTRRLLVALAHSAPVGLLLFPPLAAVLDIGGLWLLDPVRHRWSLAVRGATLLAAGTAHAVPARTLCSRPPPGTGFTAADLHHGAHSMYYGGDLVEAGRAVVMGVCWYAGAGRARARRRRRVGRTERLTGPAGALGDHHRTPAAGGES
jgi:cytochrome c oxidase assembly factor CtaG